MWYVVGVLRDQYSWIGQTCQLLALDKMNFRQRTNFFIWFQLWWVLGRESAGSWSPTTSVLQSGGRRSGKASLGKNGLSEFGWGSGGIIKGRVRDTGCEGLRRENEHIGGCWRKWGTKGDIHVTATQTWQRRGAPGEAEEGLGWEPQRAF